MVKTRLFWIDGLKKGRLAISARPCGGEQLPDEIEGWQQSGVQAVCSLLREDEITQLGLTEEKNICNAHGIEFESFPISDRGVPESSVALRKLIRQAEAWLADGKSVLIHCRIGIGRSALVAALVLATLGVDISTAFEHISKARTCPVPDTAEQRQWAIRFAQDMLSVSGH